MWHTATAVVWPLLVAFRNPGFGDLAHLADGIEQVRVQCLFTVGSVETLDKDVLIRLSGFDEQRLDLALLTLFSERDGGELSAVVHA